MHALDASLKLEPLSEGRYRGDPPLAYWNMVGPYGGISAAIALKGVLDDPRCQGEPLSLTVNYCAPVRDCPYELVVENDRTSRTTQHWSIAMRQPDPNEPQRTTTTVRALAVMGRRRDVWEAAVGGGPPAVPGPHGLRSRKGREGIRWFEHYDSRFVDSPMKTVDPDAPVVSWVRDHPPRPIDYPALAALADTFFPAIFAKRKAVMPIATVSMNVYFHATAGDLSAVGDRFLLGVSRSSVYRGGFFDCESQLWADERLIATTQQIVWYRE
jgi:Thioesterase-like superfamily